MPKTALQWTIFIILASLISLPSFSVSQHTPSAQVTLSIQKDGVIDAKVRITHSKNLQPPGPILISFPFRFDKSAKIETSDDTRIVILSQGENYTLVAVLILSQKQEALFVVKSAIIAGKAGLNRVNLEFDFSYPSFSARDKALDRLPICYSVYNLRIRFPVEVSIKQVSHNRAGWVRLSGQEYSISESGINTVTKAKEKVWIAFPNFERSQALIANAFISGVIMLFALLVSPFLISGRTKFELILIFVISLIGIGGALYIIPSFWGTDDRIVWIIRGGCCFIASAYYAIKISLHTIKSMKSEKRHVLK